MAFYDQAYPTWSGPSRASPFENRPNLPKLDEHNAFNHQLEEVEKAIDNLVKSGKLYTNVSATPVVTPVSQVATRRDSVPAMNSIPRSPLESGDARMTQTIPSRHYSLHSLDNVRPSQSYANLHSYFVNQRSGQRTPDDDLQLLQLKRRIALQRDGKPLASELSTSNGTSATGSASSSLILDTNIAGSDPIHTSLALSEVVDDPYASHRRRLRMGSTSIDGLVGVIEAELTPRGPQTAGIIGMQNTSRTSPTASFDPFSQEFGIVGKNQREQERRLREQRSRESNATESPSPRSATFSLFSSESTQTNTNTTASSPESSPLKSSKPSLPSAKIAPIGTKRSSGSLNSENSDGVKSHSQISATSTSNAPLPSPRMATPTNNDTDKWGVFSGGWTTPFVGSDAYHSRSGNSESSSQKRIWGSGPKGLGMTVGSGSVDVWG